MKERDLSDAYIFIADKKVIVKGSIELTESGMTIDFFTKDEGIEEGDLVAVEAVAVPYDVTKEGRIGKN